jgi:hypothetical protein
MQRVMQRGSIVGGRWTSCWAAGVVGVLALTPLAALGDDAPDLLTEPFSFSLGTYILDSDTDVSLDGEVSEGSEVDWDNTFGGGDVTRFRVDGYWRFGDSDRHKVRALWFNYSRSKSKVLDEEIIWDDDVYPVDAKVNGELTFDIYELAYEYSFLHRDNFEVAANVGLHYANFSATLSAKAENSNGTLDEDLRREGSVGAPLPVIGLRALWRLPYDLWIDASGQFFALSIDEYDGNLQDYKVALTWQPKKWLGVGIGYDRFSVDVDVDKERFSGSLDWTYSGPMIFYSAAF